MSIGGSLLGLTVELHMGSLMRRLGLFTSPYE